MWVIEMLVQEQPNKLRGSNIVDQCGWDRRLVDDAVYYLIQDGRIMLRGDSTFGLCTPEFAIERECRDPACRRPTPHAGACDRELYTR